MKKLLLIAALAMTLMANAQTITIGDDTSLSNTTPINSLYNYSITEQIYLASEIEFAGYIKSVRFRIAYSYNTECTNDIVVYMKHVSKSAFTSPSDYEPLTTDNIVYSGPWTIPANTDGWIAIDFDTPFAYNGTDNLLIAIDENSDDFNIRYFMYSGANSTVLSYFSDTQNPDPYDISSFAGIREVSSQRSNIKLVFGQVEGVVENSLNTIAVYPNPTEGLLYLDGIDQENVKVYDVTGRLVMQANYDGQLNISPLERGFYFITTSKGMVKFLKQ